MKEQETAEPAQPAGGRGAGPYPSDGESAPTVGVSVIEDKSGTAGHAAEARRSLPWLRQLLPSSGWVWFGFALTALWLAFVVWLAYGNHVGGFIERTEKLALNELGDFFAGLFAPLAFLWLLVAVMVQSQELGYQKEELAETRVVLRAQADQMRAQTEILRQDAEKRSDDLEYERLDDEVGIFLLWARSLPGELIIQTADHRPSFPLASSLPTVRVFALNLLAMRVVEVGDFVREAEGRFPRPVGLTNMQAQELELWLRRLAMLATSAKRSKTADLCRRAGEAAKVLVAHAR
jgi:hypothetical protein